MENDAQSQQGPSTTTERANRSARFFSNLYRWRSLARRLWWIPLITVSLGLSVQWYLVSNAPAIYISLGKMIVSMRISIPEGQIYSEELSNFLGTQVALMQSGEVMRMALERLSTNKPPLTPVPFKLQVAVTPKTSIFELRVSSGEPKYAQAYLEACMNAYIDFKNRMRENTSEKTLKVIVEEMNRLDLDLRKGEAQIEAFQASNSVASLTTMDNSAALYLSELSRELEVKRTEFEYLNLLTLDQNIQLQHQRAQATESANNVSTEADPLQTDESYRRAKQEILALEVEREERSQVWRPQHPRMVKLDENIASRKNMLAILRNQSQEQLANRRIVLSLQISNLVQKVEEWQAKSLDAGRRIAQFQGLKNNNQRLQSMFDKTVATRATLELNKEISPESVTLMEHASPALVDLGNMTKSLVMAGAAGLVIGLGILLLLNQLDDRLNSYTELKGEFDEEVLGQIPRDRQARRGGDAQLIRREDDRHAFMEAYRNLRSSLLYLSSTGARPKTILVTSSIPNDGKSMTTANLAITMALSGSRVLLVDGDLRKGVQHQRFGLQSSPGLSEALSENKPWQAHVQPTKVANLSLLSRGATTQHSSELFLNPTTAVFLRESAAQYDFVILDSPPVMAADDVTSLAPNVDGVLFVIRAQQTSARVAHAALELLYQRRVKLLGLVFNAVEANVSEYYYYKYRDYYASYPTK